MVNGYWYYPTDRYGHGIDNDIDADETRYDVDEYSWMFAIERDKKTRKAFTDKERTEILDLFHRTCNGCKKHEDLQIHHKDKDPSNDYLSNLELLCYSCHKKVHRKLKLAQNQK